MKKEDSEEVNQRTEKEDNEEVDQRVEENEDKDGFDRLENIIEENLEGVVNGDNDAENIEMGRVEFPNTEADDEFAGGYRFDVAQQAGRFSDKVHMDSPADEAGAIGRDALKETVDKSREKLAEKLNEREESEE